MASPMARCGPLSCLVTVCVVVTEIANAAAKYPDELCKRNPPASGKDSTTASAEPGDFNLDGDAGKAKLPTVSFQVKCASGSGLSTKAVSHINACTVTAGSFTQTLKEKSGYFLWESTSKFRLPTKADSSQKMDCQVTCFAKIKPILYCFDEYEHMWVPPDQFR